MPRIAPPRAAKQSFVSLFSTVPPLLAADAARRLGIANPDGTPAGMIGYEGDTVLPTLVVTDADGRIVYADETDNYRVRPTPETVLGALRAARLGAATGGGVPA